MSSAAEERIRAKAVKALQRKFPAARIIHELKLGHDIRIDVAAVTEDRIATVEIKSEKDTLKRLGPQLARAVLVSNEVWFVGHESHAERLEVAQCIDRYPKLRDDLVVLCDRHRAKVTAFTSRESVALHQVEVLWECEGNDGLRSDRPWFRHEYDRPLRVDVLLGMLWAEELREICRAHGLGVKPATPIIPCAKLIREHLTGKQIRQAVCRALRERPFARVEAVAS